MQNKEVLITGCRGLVGNACIDESINHHKGNTFFFSSRSKFNLEDSFETYSMFQDYLPDYVIHTAGRVGGIKRNMEQPYDQFLCNLRINQNVIDSAIKANVKKLIAFSSVCVFPDNEGVYHEDNMHNGPPYPAHRYYAYAKRMVDLQMEAAREQYGIKNYCTLIPANMFGAYDNFNLDDGHFIPSLIRKGYEAKLKGEPLVIWGDGRAKREVLTARDVARVCFKLLELETLPDRLIVAGETPVTIKEIGTIIADHFKVPISFDTSKPNGQESRPTNKYLFNALFPKFEFDNIGEALVDTCKWYEEFHDIARK